MESGMVGHLYCKQQTPCSKIGSGNTRIDSLCTCTAEDLEFLDTPVHMLMYVVTMHKCKAVMMVLTVSILQITVLPM